MLLIAHVSISDQSEGAVSRVMRRGDVGAVSSYWCNSSPGDRLFPSPPIVVATLIHLRFVVAYLQSCDIYLLPLVFLLNQLVDDNPLGH